MTAIPFDVFAFTHSLVDSGIPNNQADTIAQAFSKAIQESNATVIEHTNASIEQIKHEYRLDDITTNKDLDARIKETELKIELVKSDLQRDIANIKADLTRDISKVSKEISDTKAELSRTILNVGVGVGLTQIVAVFILFLRMTGKA
jgi:hypothetical protein